MTTNTKPAVIYIRGIANHSMEIQRRMIEQQVLGSDYHVVSTFTDTCSGTSDISRRPGMKQLFEVLESHPTVHDVIVYDESRLSRQLNEVSQVVQRLKDMNVEIHYAVDGLGSNIWRLWPHVLPG